MTLLRSLAVAVAMALAVVWMVRSADNYQLFVLALVGLTTIVGVGLNVLVGLTGQISLGHAAFYAIGAYTVGILTTRYDLSFWLAWPIAGAVAALAGLALAVPALRVRGPYLAMVTIAFGFVVEQGAAELKDLTGGWNGMLGIETPSAAGYSFRERDIAIFILVLTIMVMMGYARFAVSPWGKAMRAVRDAESAGQSIGLSPVLLRATAFALSAALAGLAGGIYASMSNFISPESFPFLQSILFLLVVMVGGTGRVMGPLVGACVVVLLPEILSALAQYRLLFVGILLFVMLRLAPNGIVGFVTGLLPKRMRASHDAAVTPADVAPWLMRSVASDPLSVCGLSIAFGGIRAVNDVAFEAKPGEILSVIGPNGAGKTTVLNLICGFYLPDAGRVAIGGDDLTGHPSHVVARAAVARTYQTTQLFSTLSVLDNVRVALRAGRLSAADAWRRDDDIEASATADGLLRFAGYRGSAETVASDLPHGDRRLVEIARALALRPRYLVLDEPAAGLGEEDTRRLAGLLERIAGLGIGVVLVEHDMDLVMAVSARIVVLDAGQKIAEGTPDAVRADQRVRAAYLGETHVSTARRPAPPAAAPVLLAVKKLEAGYGGIRVLRGIDLEVRRGELVAVLGANGAGKTTLMRALTGLIRPSAGGISFAGQNLAGLSASRIATTGLALVPEGRQVFPELTVVDNLRLGAFARPTADIDDRVEAMLRRFPRLGERRQQRAGLLSGGEQQMLAIGRGLMARPELLLLDEPSQGLAPRLIAQLFETLAEIRDDGVTILLVDQMAALALEIADRAYVLSSGSVVASGPAAEVANAAALHQAYLGS